jgi:hypothetical protein
MNMNTGKVNGNYTTRDTIYIAAKDKGYEIRNNRWRKNDYDNQGWRNQLHAINRPMPTYTALYDNKLSSLEAEMSGFFTPLYLDLNKGFLYKRKDKAKPYKRL